MEKCIRCSIVGLDEGGSITAILNGKAVVFTAECAQHDVPAFAPAPAPVAPLNFVNPYIPPVPVEQTPA
jgi:hypothetical protein